MYTYYFRLLPFPFPYPVPLPNDLLSVIKKKKKLSDAFSTVLNHLFILYSFICIAHLLSFKKASMSGHSGYSRESKNLVNLFDLFSRHSVGLKKKEKKSSSSSGIWMDMFAISRKLGYSAIIHFLVGFQIRLLHLVMKIWIDAICYLGTSVTVQSTLWGS